MGAPAWSRAVSAGARLLLDGATGTELERRGVLSTLPLWSAHALIEAPEQVAQVHAEYAAAGAELLTANTFRTQRRALSRGGHGGRSAELTALAVRLAREGARSGAAGIAVLGSAPPLEDCFAPERAPEDDALAAEHAEHAENLAAAGVDGVLVETMNSVREARAALRAASACGLAAWVSFVCWRGARLLSGEPLADALEALAAERVPPVGVGVNCLPVSNVAACLPALATCGLPFGVYANMGAPEEAASDAAVVRHREELPPERFAAAAREWLDAGARLVGGCCGTSPRHIAALYANLRA